MNELTVYGDISGNEISCNNLTCDSLNCNNIYPGSKVSSNEVTGNIKGDFSGNIDGDFTGNIKGTMTGNLDSLYGTLNSYKGEDILFDGNKITFTYNGDEYTGYVFGC